MQECRDESEIYNYQLSIVPSQQLKKALKSQSIVEWTSIRRASRWSIFIDIFLIKTENIFT